MIFAMDTDALDNFQLDLGSASEIGMAVVLAVMMFAVALGLRPANFAFFKTQPKLYLTGVAAQIIGLPLLTLLLCFIVSPHPSVALGMILIACCPGGNTSNLIALFARANTALSVSLTATSSVMAAIITPISILFWSGLYPPTRALLTEINIDVVSFLTQTLVILATPSHWNARQTFRSQSRGEASNTISNSIWLRTFSDYSHRKRQLFYHLHRARCRIVHPRDYA